MEFNFDKIDKRKITTYLLVAAAVLLVFQAGFLIGKSTTVCKVCKPEAVDFSLFWDAYNKLQEKFISPDAIINQKIIYGAIEGMTKSLGDPYTDFFDPQQAKMFQQDLAGSFDGIGAEVGIKKEQLIVISPLKSTPAEKAGLRAGDQIITIDGKSTDGMSTDEAVNLIRGKRGSQVILGIFREGFTQVKDFTITRDTIKIPSMEWELLEGEVAHIKMYQFGQTLSADFKKTASEILSSPAKKIVLDVRNNPGGYLEICQEIAGWFLEPNDLVVTEDFGKNREPQKYLAEGNGALADYPTVVLINQGSASASEILAGALHDNRGVQLIGEKSFGKGSVQEVVELQDGKSFLKITIAKWLTPKGISISDVGLAPDIKIEAGENESETGKDAQLEKALEIIRGMQ